MVTSTPTTIWVQSGGTVIEGGKLAYTINLSEPASEDIVISYRTRNPDGTYATPDNSSGQFDYVPYGGTGSNPVLTTYTILAGQTSATIEVQTHDDSLVEGSEFVGFAFNVVSGPAVLDTRGNSAPNGDATSTGTIIDNDSGEIPTTIWVQPGGTVVEGGKLVYTINLSGPASEDIVISYRTRSPNSTYATEDNGGNQFDYEPVGGSNTDPVQTTTYTIPAGQTSATIEVQTHDDSLVEANEFVGFAFNVVSGPAMLDTRGNSAGNGDATSTGTIIDNDAAVGEPTTIWVEPGVSVVEGGKLAYTINLSEPASEDIVISYRTRNPDGTYATPDNSSGQFDYVPYGGTGSNPVLTTYTILAGQTSATIEVQTHDDSLVEGSEFVGFAFNVVSGPAVLDTRGNSAPNGDATSTGTIIDNDSGEIPVAAVIGTPTVTTVTEDTGVDASGHLIASGTISISDANAGQASFQTAVTKAAGTLGNLVLQANGSYTYAVENSAVQSLSTGQTKVETFTIAAADGTTKDVTFTISGQDEVVTPPPPPPADPVVVGTTGNDTLTGTTGDDQMSGGLGGDTLIGGAGNDRMTGGTGKDILTGGTGPDSQDQFAFDAPVKKSNVDRVTDFERKYDQILLDDAFFKGLGKGTPDGTPLKKSMFAANEDGEATSDGAQIVYETDTGKLFYDADGEGGKNAVQFAVLDGRPKLSISDFEII